jgi:hypothetical protein
MAEQQTTEKFAERLFTQHCTLEEFKVEISGYVQDAIRAHIERVRELEGELPPWKYECGCPVARSEKLKLFCPRHTKMLVEEEGQTWLSRRRL